MTTIHKTAGELARAYEERLKAEARAPLEAEIARLTAELSPVTGETVPAPVAVQYAAPPPAPPGTPAHLIPKPGHVYPVAAPCAGCAALQVDLAFAKSQRDDNENAWQCEKQKRQAAETALASAREIVADIPESVFQSAEHGTLTADDAIEAVGDLRILRTLLTSHPSPAPVAAPCATEELVDYLEAAARDLPLEQFLIAMRRKLLESNGR